MMLSHLKKTFLAGERLILQGLANSKGLSQEHAFDMQANQSIAIPLIFGLYTPGGNIPLPKSS